MATNDTRIRVTLEDQAGDELSVTAGALHVTGTVTSGGAQTDDAPFTPGTGTVTMLGAFADETGPDSVDEGDGGAVRMTLTRALHTNPRNASGTEIFTVAAPGVVQGAAADGAAVSGSPVLIGGQDGTNAQSILTDTTGRQVVVGAAAIGATVGGNPVLIGGSDAGGLARTLLFGADNADAVAVATNSIARLAAEGYVFNGTTWDRKRGNTSGSFVQGTAADGAAVAGNPVRVGGKDSSGNTQDLIASSIGAAGVAVLSGVVLDPNAGETLTVKTKAADVASSGDNDVITAVAGKKIRVLSYALQAKGTVAAKFEDDGTATQRSVEWSFQDREGVSRSAPTGAFLFETGEGVGLDLNLSAAVEVSYEVVYVEVE